MNYIVSFYSGTGRLLRTLTVLDPRKWCLNHFNRYPSGSLQVEDMDRGLLTLKGVEDVNKYFPK